MSMMTGKMRIAFIGMFILMMSLTIGLVFPAVADVAGFLSFAGMFLLVSFGLFAFADEYM
jgi:hypothetical protein